MSDAATSPASLGQFADVTSKGDWQDVVIGGAGRLKQQAHASAHDSWGLRRHACVRP